MKELPTGSMWVCERADCRERNDDSVYRCCKCDSVKPYLLSTDCCFENASIATDDDDDLSPFRSEEVTSYILSQRHAHQGDGARPKDRQRRGGVGTQTEKMPLIDFSDSNQGPAGRMDDDNTVKANTRQEAATSQKQPVHGAKTSTGPDIEFPDSTCRLVLVGRTGNGKSSTGNSILGLARFEVGDAFDSQTSSCQMYKADRYGLSVEVVDTPGFFDTNTPEERLLKEIRTCIGMVSPGPHALCVVIGGRFTAEQVETVEEIVTLFGSKVLRHMIVIFTFGDTLARGQGEGRCEDYIQEKLDKAPSALRKLVKEDLDNRFVVFNNVGSLPERESQVRQLLQVVKKVVQDNGGQPYSHKLLADCENVILNYEKRLMYLLNKDDLMTRHEVRRVFKSLLENDANARDLVDKLLETQSLSSRAVEELEETKSIMGTMIEQHKQKTDELYLRLNQRRCHIL